MIQEIARRFDDEGRCEKTEISAEIKKVLADKIKEHKITEKWIEECLPSEYKRKYARKSERSSLSNQLEKAKAQSGNIVDNGDGSALLINHDAGHDGSSNNRENIATVTSSSKA